MENDQNLTGSGREKQIDSRSIGAVVIWGIAAIALSIFVCTYNNSPMVLGASSGVKILAIVTGSVFGLVGALIGNAIRKFALPDAFFTSGGMGQIIWTKLFWLCGPQLVGLGIGTILGCTLVLR